MRQSRKQSSGRSGRGSVSHFSCCCTFYERCVLFVCVRWARARARARARAWTRARAQARARARSHPRTHTHTCTQTLTKHARSRTRFKRTGGATTQHERGFVARSTCLGLGLREREPLGLGGREVHGRGPSRPCPPASHHRSHHHQPRRLPPQPASHRARPPASHRMRPRLSSSAPPPASSNLSHQPRLPPLQPAWPPAPHRTPRLA